MSLEPDGISFDGKLIGIHFRGAGSGSYYHWYMRTEQFIRVIHEVFRQIAEKKKEIGICPKGNDTL